MDIQYISREEILQDFFFCFSSERQKEALEKSIRMSGIRTPLHLIQLDNGFRILAGFQRFRIADKIRLEKLPAVIISNHHAIANAFHDAVLEHLSFHLLNLVEKARILAILKKLNISHDSLYRVFLPLLQIPRQDHVLDSISGILKLDSRVHDYIEHFDLSLKQTEPFKRLSKKEQGLFVDMGLKFQIRIVELTGIMDLIWEIARRDNQTCIDIYKRMNISDILNNPESTRSEKISKLKIALNQKRYPRLSLWNQNILQHHEKLVFPSFIKIIWDHSLESPGVRLQAEIHSVEELNQLASCLSQKGNVASFTKIFEIV